MPDMADYRFYTEVYLGIAIPEPAFNSAAARAKDALERFQRQFSVRSCGPVSEDMAQCAMAEAIYAHSKRDGAITSATIGNTSVHYSTQKKSLQRQLLEKASIYLDICRGVG